MVKVPRALRAGWVAIPVTPGRLLLMGCLLLGLVAPAAGATGSPAHPDASGYQLFVSSGPDVSDQRLTELDTVTLADDPGGETIDLDSQSSRQASGPRHVHTRWVASNDGSTLVGAVYRDGADHGQSPVENLTLIVRDGWTGAERDRFSIAEAVAYPAIPLVSADGSTVVFAADRETLVHERMIRASSWSVRFRRAQDWASTVDLYDGNPPPMLRWYVYDTASGRLRTTVDAAGPQMWGVWIDPTGSRLYYLVGSTSPPGTAGAATRIIAHDLRTGAETGQVELPEVGGGVWREEGYVTMQLMPGAALSPDGSTLAVVATDLSRVTMIDTGRMAVERQVAVRSTPGALERLGRWLGLLPAEAAAKGTAGTRVAAVYAPDGRHLYVFGETTVMSADEPFARHGLGLTVIDLTNGEIVASAFPDVWFLQVLPAPDGHAIYTVQGTLDDLVQRVDAETLEVEAERTFAGDRWFMLRPGSANA